ncbi:MAG TPA: C25 family cysteine peptidase [Candidatus Polarisedimenticolia bacterium]|jgi:hypothetical protein
MGYLRFQKFVEVIYTPVVPRAGGASGAPSSDDGTTDLDFYPDIDLLLEVNGIDWDQVSRDRAEVPPDPHFEGIYRTAFVNYEEGRAWRTRRSNLPEGASATNLLAPLVPQAASLVPPMSYPFAGATTPVYRIGVKADGIYRLSYSYLLASGTGVAPGLAGATPQSFKLVAQGVEVPIRVVTAVAGTFGPGDYIEFFGQGKLGEPDLVLNQAIDPSTGYFDIYQANDFTDVNVYFLFAEPGTRQRIPSLTGTFNGALPLQTAFTDTVHREYDNRFVPNGFDDPFYQGPPLATFTGNFTPDPNAVNCGYNNQGVHDKLPDFLGPSSDPNSTSCPACDLNLPAADPNGAANVATVTVRFRGATSEPAVNPDHMTVVQVGTTASRSTTLCWDGERLVEQVVTVPQSALAGAGIYIGQPGLSTTVSTEGFYLDWIEVSNYLRAFKLGGGEVIGRFANAASSYQVSGFDANSPANMIVYDVSATVPGSTVPSPRIVTGGTIVQLAPTDFAVKFSLAADGSLPPGTQRVFAAAGSTGFRLPFRVEEVSGDDLASTDNAADMIVITTPDVAGTPHTPAFQDYIAHREADSGLSIRTVMINDIYDHFSFGVETPEAIRSFLAYAVDNWGGPLGASAAPSYVLLLGDTSVDYKNNTADAAWVNQVPTFIMYSESNVLDYYASDTYIAAFRGADQYPDIHLGRISVRNSTEAGTVFQKLTEYDTSAPTGLWRGIGLFLADKGNPGTGETAEFEGLQTFYSGTYFVPPFSYKRIFYEDPSYGNGADWSHWRSDYVAAADAGAALTSYVGHGNFIDWGIDPNGLFISTGFRDDFTLLSETHKPTFLINENCLIGGFHALGTDSLGEKFLKVPGKGAAAVFAPSGLSFVTSGELINAAIYPAMFGLSKERRFGDLITMARVSLASSVLPVADMQAYVLLGDPAERFILPAPRPPSDFAATTGLDARVDLTWSPGPDTGVLTRIYRREAFNGTYVLVNPSGATGTSYSDTSAINGKAYFYRAVSFDPNGPYEGAVTNFNTTCNFSNPPASDPDDCVWAVPTNPNPPAPPAEVAVGNPGSGDHLSVSWRPNIEPDISRYSVLIGTTSGGPYQPLADTSPTTTSLVVGGLTTGQPYYFVVTATNFTGRTSALSAEAAGLPQVFEGVAPPDMISTLDLRRAPSQPASIELLWTPPSQDIYGGPTVLESFSIYRGLMPAFVADANTMIATITDPNAGSYIDPNSFSTPSNYYYLITATDANGFASGAGQQLPAGISDLRLSINGANIAMIWSPVTTDIDGGPTSINHYLLYGGAMPVDRLRIETMTPLISGITGTSTQTPIPSGTMFFYTVIAVDAKGNKSPF